MRLVCFPGKRLSNMKKCPQCNSIYSDDSLSFCLSDGSHLEDHDPARTESMNIPDTDPSGPKPPRADRMRIDVSADDDIPTVAAAKISAQTPVKKGVSGGLVAAIVGILLIVIVSLGAVIAYVLYTQDGPAVARDSDANSKDAEVERLKDRIDELGNRLAADVKKEADNSPSIKISPSPADEEPEFDEEVIKRVNSPGDGFLALRDRPDSEKGSRVAKIPHGDIVVMGKCQENEVIIGGRKGRWCQATWEGYSGWVFDVWLTD